MEFSVDTLIHKAIAQQDLTFDESYFLFDATVKGELNDIVLSSLLTALKIKGETADEISGAAKALKDNAKAFPKCDYKTADNSGTGGDGYNTINISTTSAILAAHCGIKVAKHGNRKVSSQSGSADVLSQLGIELAMSPEQAKVCLDETNLTFIMAPLYHEGIRHAMPVRQTLKTRTIFNILGPLVIPTKSEVKLVGVYSPELCKPVAQALQMLGHTDAWVVHGSGLDEIALHGPTQVVQLRNNEITEFTISPEQVGLPTADIETLTGGTPEQNAQTIKDILSGKGKTEHNNAVALNTAPLLYLYGLSDSFEDGVKLALDTINSGNALQTCERFAHLSQQ